MRSYHPTVEDFFPTTTQKLSCREGGKADYVRTQGKPRLSAWGRVSLQRHKAGISRSRRVALKKNPARAVA